MGNNACTDGHGFDYGPWQHVGIQYSVLYVIFYVFILQGDVYHCELYDEETLLYRVPAVWVNSRNIECESHVVSMEMYG